MYNLITDKRDEDKKAQVNEIKRQKMEQKRYSLDYNNKTVMIDRQRKRMNNKRDSLDENKKAEEKA